MIISQDDPKASMKTTGTADAPPSAAAPSYHPPPPAYEAASSSPELPTMATATTPLNEQWKNSPEDRKRPRRRFLKAFLIALGLYILVSLLVSSIVDGFRHDHRYPGSGDGTGPWGDPAVPEGSDGSIGSSDDCQPDNFRFVSDSSDKLVSEPESDFDDHDHEHPFPGYPGHGPWGDGDDHDHPRGPPGGPRGPGGPPRGPMAPLIYQANYSLPATLESIYFLSRGRHSKGSYRYELASDDAKNISIQVEVRYWRPDVLGSVNMCTLKRNDKAMGFGIFTPERPWDWMKEQDSVSFDVHVRIPPSSLVGSKAPLASLSSWLPNFRQSLGEFDPKTIWENINLHGSNGGIFSRSQLQANNLTITTTNGPIMGRYFSDNVLSLKTSNAFVFVDVELQNKRGAAQKSIASLVTTNGRINATVTLDTIRQSVSSSASSFPGKGGLFDVTAKSSNAAIDLTIPVSPYQSTQHISSRTTNSANLVRLHRTFEGKFDMSTSNSGVTFVAGVGKEDDPSGHGRKPNTSIWQDKGRASGWFYWGRQEDAGSSVEVHSSNSPVSLRIL